MQNIQLYFNGKVPLNLFCLPSSVDEVDSHSPTHVYCVALCVGRPGFDPRSRLGQLRLTSIPSGWVNEEQSAWWPLLNAAELKRCDREIVYVRLIQTVARTISRGFLAVSTGVLEALWYLIDWMIACCLTVLQYEKVIQFVRGMEICSGG